MQKTLALIGLTSIIVGCGSGSSSDTNIEPTTPTDSSNISVPAIPSDSLDPLAPVETVERQLPEAFNQFTPVVIPNSHLVTLEWENSLHADNYTICVQASDSTCDSIGTTTDTTRQFSLHQLSGIANKEYFVESVNKWGAKRSNSIALNDTILMQAASLITGEAGDIASAYGGNIDISADGKRAIVSSSTTIATSNNKYQVLVYEYDNGEWQLILSPSNLALNTWAGMGVAISGDGRTIAYNDNYNDDIHIYHDNGTTWDLVDTISTADTTRNFGTSLALSYNGQTLAIGDTSAHSAKEDLLHIHVYNKDFSPLHNITIDDSNAAVDSDLGHSVDVSDDGSTVVAGAPSIHPNDLTKQGGSIVFKTSDNWSSYTSYISFIKDQGIHARISGNGERVCLGSESVAKVVCETFDGYATFELTPQGTGTPSMLWGASFDINNDGTLIAVGNYADSTHSASEKGYVEVIDISSTPSLLYELNANSHDILEYGYSVALSSQGNALLVGAPGNAYTAANKTPALFSY